MPTDLDYTDIGAYLVSISRRIASLEVDVEVMSETLRKKAEIMKKSNDDSKSQLHDVKTELGKIKNSVSEISMSINSVVKNFQSVARKTSVERLNRRIDDWNPEKMATHHDLHKELEKAKKQRLSEP